MFHLIVDDSLNFQIDCNITKTVNKAKNLITKEIFSICHIFQGIPNKLFSFFD